ncbi:MAG: PAS domain-containing protein, partial [Spirochaetales bacterium]|nr:PAS domain-containing protein [Spirochaetales bacterium]
MKKRPLFGATFAIIITLILLAITPLTIFNINEFKDFFFNETENNILETCSLLKNILSGRLPVDIPNLQEITKHTAESTNLRITIIAEDGRVLSDSHKDPKTMDNHANRPEIIAAINSGEGSSTRTSVSLKDKMMYAAVCIKFSNGELGVIRLSKSLKEIQSKISTIRNSSLIFLLVIVIISTWVCFIIAGQVSIFLKKLKSTTEHYSKGDFSQRLYIEKPAEIVELSEYINRMGQQLEERIDTINEQTNELKLILDNMTEAVFYTDVNLHLQRINGAAEALFEINQDKDKGRTILEFIRSSKFSSFAEKLIKTGKSGEDIFTLDQPQTIYLDIIGTVLKDKTGTEPVALLFVMHDITKMVQLEQMRQDFVANVSHELKT